MGLGLHNTNHYDTIDGPTITVPPRQAKLVDARTSCGNAVLDAIGRLHQHTGATEHGRCDIVAEVQATGSGFERQTIYRCIRRMTGHEPAAPTATSKTSAMVNCDLAVTEPTHITVGTALAQAAGQPATQRSPSAPGAAISAAT